MNQLILLTLCVLSIELFVRSHVLLVLDSVLRVAKKAVVILPKKNISDHWKEKAVPAYAFMLMKYSLKLLLIIICIISLFFIANYFQDGFLIFVFTFMGVIESICFSIAYIFLRRFILNE